MANYFSIKYNGVELYPDHIYDWKVSGVNCSTEDYSVGSVNDISLVFVTDIKPEKNSVTGEYERVSVDSSTPIYFKVREIIRNANQNRYTVTCSSEYDELDQLLPASYATPLANETVWQLFNRLQGFTVTSAPSSVKNGDYVISESWYSPNMTYRQAYSYLVQLMGMDIGSFLRTAGTSSDMSNRFPFDIDAQESNVLKFTPDNVKEIEIADYSVPTIKGVWVETNDPNVPYYQQGSTNPYESLVLPFNPMASNNTFISDLYDKVTALQSYTPITLTTWTDAHYYEGVAKITQVETMVWWSTRKQWIKYTDDDGISYYCPIFNWELSPSGLTLQGTGNPQRQYDSGYAFEQAVNAIQEKVNHLTFVDIYPNWSETADLNNCKNIGLYSYKSPAANRPDTANGTLYVFRYGSNNLYQVAFANNSANDDEVYVYVRKYNSSGFHAWRRLEVI